MSSSLPKNINVISKSINAVNQPRDLQVSAVLCEPKSISHKAIVDLNRSQYEGLYGDVYATQHVHIDNLELSLLKRAREILARTGRREYKVLELGAGSGRLTRVLVRIDGVRVIAVDISPRQLAYARAALPEKSRLYVEHVEADALEYLHGCHQRYDMICMASTLHHFVNPKELLSRCINALSPGGYLWLAHEPLANSAMRFTDKLLLLADHALYFDEENNKNLTRPNISAALKYFLQLSMRKLNRRCGNIETNIEEESSAISVDVSVDQMDPSLVKVWLTELGMLNTTFRTGHGYIGNSTYFLAKIFHSRGSWQMVSEKPD